MTKMQIIKNLITQLSSMCWGYAADLVQAKPLYSYLAFTELSTDGDATVEGMANVHIVPYFCNGAAIGTKRADCDTIVRAMIRRMAIQPDRTLADAANSFYTEHTSSSSYDGELKLEKHWEPLFRKLLKKAGNNCRFVFLIDALNECSEPKEWEKFLKFMNRILKAHTNVSLICSSHVHVDVRRRFRPEDHGGHDVVKVEYATPQKTAEAMRSFIDGELTRRNKFALESIFCMFSLVQIHARS